MLRKSSGVVMYLFPPVGRGAHCRREAQFNIKVQCRSLWFARDSIGPANGTETPKSRAAPLPDWLYPAKASPSSAHACASPVTFAPSSAADDGRSLEAQPAA